MKNKLRIGLIMQVGAGWMGGVEYVRNIILALASLPHEERATFEVTLLTSASTNPEFVESIRPHVKDVYLLNELVVPNFFEKVVSRIRTRIFKQSDRRYDVVLEKHGIDFVYPVMTWNCNFSMDRAVGWIPDFQHQYLPQYFSAQELKERETAFSRLARFAPLVVLSSKTAAADFARLYPDMTAKSRVLSFKSVMRQEWFEGNPVEIQRKYNLPERFFLISNQFWQHKGHLTVINALKLLKDRGLKPVVVCTGELNDYRQPQYGTRVLENIDSFGLSEQVVLVGLIPKLDQIQLLRRSLALIQPSQFEGWSTVVEEARCLGKAIILSDFPVHVEQNPPKSRFFECHSASALAEIMADFWETKVSGPELGQEALARETNKKECQEFASAFLSIARSFVESQST
jgi:glycosyltransferase involved in cell wall biosynthesis